jgi:hypothetical protein
MMQPNRTNSPWTPELQKCVLGLAGKGMSATAIAGEVGMTKNQIIGWFNRHHIGGFRRPNRKPYNGPTTVDRLRAWHDKMNKLVPPERRIDLSNW